MLRTWPFALVLAAVASGCGSGGSTSSSAATTTGGATCVPGASAPCACIDGRMGAQQCQADGRSFGACFCVGPGSSSSASASGGGGAGNGGSSSSSASGGAGGGSVALGDAAWASAFGGTSGAQIFSMAIDSSGAVVVGGLFSGLLQLGDTAATCPVNAQCGFIAKLAANGAFAWGAAFVGTDANGNVDQAMLAIGPSDEVYVAGGFLGAVDFGSGPVGGTSQRLLYVSKYEAAGTLDWNRHYLVAAGGGASANGAVVKSDGHLVVEGRISTTIDFGLGAVGPGTYLVDLGGNGVAAQSTAFANTMQDSGSPVAGASTLARTTSDDLILVGETASGADLGCGPLPDGAAFVAGLDATGGCRFTNPYANVHAQGVAVDPGDDSISVAGYLANGASLTIGPDALVGQGQYDALLFHLGSAGEELWGKNFGAVAGTQIGFGVAVEPSSGDIALTGAADGAIDFGAGPVSGSGRIFAAVFDRDATPRWAARLGSTMVDVGYACGFASSDRLVVAGSFDGTIGFPSKVIQANGFSSGFAVEIAVP
jgi:hypothetical protein